jgi:hypothetical protein
VGAAVAILCAAVVAAAIAWTGARVARAFVGPRDRTPTLTSLLSIFAPGVAAVADDPRALLAWQPLAEAARQLFPAEFVELDRAYGGTFPFSAEQIQAAHSRWTADWLAWERNHDAECKLKTLAVEHELAEAVGSAYGRARLDGIEREKLDRYQRHYEEYTRIAKGLQALVPKNTH